MPVIIPPWSYSALEKFENCPKQYYHVYILKEKEPDTVHTKHGTLVHLALENRLKNKTILPEGFSHYEPLVNSVEKIVGSGQLKIELPLALDKEFKPIGFFDKNVWGRGKADVVVKKGPKVWIADWKTGKIREKMFQVSVFAAFIFKMFPEVTDVHANNIWLQENKIGENYKFSKSGEPSIWAEIIRKINRIELAAEKENFPPKQSGLCGFCSVTSCAFNPNKRD